MIDFSSATPPCQAMGIGDFLCPEHKVAEMGRRWDMDEATKARTHANVPLKVPTNLLTSESWHVAFWSKWNHLEDTMRLECRASEMCLRHAPPEKRCAWEDHRRARYYQRTRFKFAPHSVTSCVHAACSATLPYKLVGLLQRRTLQTHHLGRNGLMLGRPVAIHSACAQRDRRRPLSVGGQSLCRMRPSELHGVATFWTTSTTRSLRATDRTWEPRYCRRSSTSSFASVETENKPCHGHTALQGWKKLAPTYAWLSVPFVGLVAMVAVPTCDRSRSLF